MRSGEDDHQMMKWAVTYQIGFCNHVKLDSSKRLSHLSIELQNLGERMGLEAIVLVQNSAEQIHGSPNYRLYRIWLDYKTSMLSFITS